MAHFHVLCHGNCSLRYVGGVLELSKLDFRGVKFQINVKKDDFRGLIAKIRYLRSILTSTTHIWIMPWELCPEIFQSDSRAQKIDFSGPKGQYKKGQF